MLNLQQELDATYTLNVEQIAFFNENGFIKLKQVLSSEVLAHYRKLITDKVVELNTMHLPMEERSTYQRAFLQVMNLWEQDEGVKEFVFGKRLAQIATDLLGTTGVRLYHDQALYKEPSGGITPWHADQSYWPLTTDRSITVWVPLQETTLDMGALAFAAKSQSVDLGRGMPISDESEKQIQANLEAQNFEYMESPYELGEVSFHFGWTFHRAGPNTSDKSRSVMTIIYMDEDMKLAQPTNDNQQADWDRWCPVATIGDVIDTPLNPVLFSRK